MTSLRHICCLFLMLFPLATRAAMQLAPVVVSGTLSPRSADEVPGAVTVIPREEIESRPGATASDLLRNVPGVYLDSPGGRGAVNSLYLRGGDPNYTSVLIDGIRVNDPTNTRGGSFDFAKLDADAIERIEVIRGAASAVHGADALAGVVNIVTRKGPDQATQSFGAGYGERGYYRADASAGGPLAGRANYAISAGQLDNGEDAAFSSFENQHVNGKLSGVIGEATEWQAFARYADSRAAHLPEDSGGPEFAVIRDLDRRDSQELSAGSHWLIPLAEAVDMKILVGAYWNDEQQDSPGVEPGLRDPFGIPPNRFDNAFARYQAAASFDVDLSARLALSAGMETQYEDGESDSVLDVGFPLQGRFRLDRFTHSGYSELRFAPGDDWVFSLGARLDAVDDISTEFSPRIALSKRLAASGTLLKASYGEGFRPPSFFALGNPIVGNPKLKPERSQSFELGLSQPLWQDRLRFDLNVFSTRYFDIVDLEEQPALRLVNRSEVLAIGGEAVVSAHLLERLWLDAQVSYVDTDIRGTDERLRNRPHWQGGFKARWEPYQAWSFYLGLLGIGPSFDSSIPTGERRLNSYATLDIGANWRASERWSFSAVWENAADSDYEQTIGFESPGANLRLFAKLRL